LFQFREGRFYAGPGAALSLPVSDFGFWNFAGGTSYVFSYYRGSARRASQYWTQWLETGFRLKLRSPGFIGFSYRYQPAKDGSSHRFSVDLGFRLFSNPEGE